MILKQSDKIKANSASSHVTVDSSPKGKFAHNKITLYYNWGWYDAYINQPSQVLHFLSVKSHQNTMLKHLFLASGTCTDGVAIGNTVGLELFLFQNSKQMQCLHPQEAGGCPQLWWKKWWSWQWARCKATLKSNSLTVWFHRCIANNRLTKSLWIRSTEQTCDAYQVSNVPGFCLGCSAKWSHVHLCHFLGKL